MKRSIFVIVLSFLALSLIGRSIGFQEKAIGLDGIARPRYEIYNSLKDYCSTDKCREKFNQIEEDKIPECGENEVYHIANKTNHAQLGCKSGCVCKPGFIKIKKKNKNRCFPVDESDITCDDAYEILVVGKYDCQPYCDIGQDPLCYHNNFDCEFSYNCFCKPGYIRLDGGDCIREKRCPYKPLEDAVEEKTFSYKPAPPPIPFSEKIKVGHNLHDIN